MAIFLFVYELKVYGCTTEISMGQLLYILNILNKLFSVCVCVLEFYGLVNNEVMSSRSVNSGTVPGQAKTF